MGELLFKRFLEETYVDLQLAIFYGGINDVFHEFEKWLLRKGYLRCENGAYISEIDCDETGGCDENQNDNCS
jgi:hypothetical protein